MKRIDAIVPTIKRNTVLHAMMQTGIGGATITESRGKGSGERPTYTGAKGTARYIAEFARMDIITSIVDDSKVEKVVSAIIKTVHTGAKGDGKIFVSTVDESYDISTRNKI